ncbi:MAG TPA: hypothetical protein DIT28_15900 [Oxalobacteraceae bacterium]|nr:hypothetical protein [Oxalobacteraceae bacterium]HCN90635.1 hypothetical protein [Oxalobacteraceae bacterium]
MSKLIVGIAAVMIAGIAGAKLPAPTEEAKAAADEAKAKSAWSDKVAAYKLCLAHDRVAAYYFKAKGADAKPVTVTIPPCQDPGPYVAAQTATKVGVADAQPLGPAPIKK